MDIGYVLELFFSVQKLDLLLKDTVIKKKKL